MSSSWKFPHRGFPSAGLGNVASVPRLLNPATDRANPQLGASENPRSYESNELPGAGIIHFELRVFTLSRATYFLT